MYIFLSIKAWTLRNIFSIFIQIQVHFEADFVTLEAHISLLDFFFFQETIRLILTEHFTNLEPWNPEIDILYAVQKRGSTDCEAL